MTVNKNKRKTKDKTKAKNKTKGVKVVPLEKINVKELIGKDKVKVLNEDCLEGVQKLEERSIDLLLTAPPLVEDMKVNNYGFYIGFIKKVFGALYSKMKESSTLAILIPEYVQYKGLNRPIFAHYITLLEDLGYLYTQSIIREVGKEREYILIFRKGELDIKDINVLKIPSLNKNKGVIPFPIALTDLLVEEYSEEGDVVLDLFIGTGVTALSCLKKGRYCLGYDINEDLVKVSNHLIERFREGKIR